MPQFLIVSLLFVFSLVFPSSSFARSGCCSYHGGVCGCGCCDGTPLSSTCAPYYPECGGGYTYEAPPTCPLFSSYNSLSDRCECYSGYIASGSRCISQSQACQNELGFSSRYNSLTGNCECLYGYVIGSSGTCISGNSFCWNKYGYNSRYDSLDNTCECNYGYRWNLSGTKCISDDEACQEQFGYNSKATIVGDKCECKSGYEWQGSTCVWDTSTYTYSGFTTTSTITPAPRPTQKPTTKPTVTPKVPSFPSPTPLPEVKGISYQVTPQPTPVATSEPLTAGEIGITLGTMGLVFGLPTWGIIKLVRKFRKPKTEV